MSYVNLYLQIKDRPETNRHQIKIHNISLLASLTSHLLFQVT